MGKMTLEELRKLREEGKKTIELRDPNNKEIEIIVGMGTSGIAAGAKETLDAFLKILEEKNLTNVLLRQTGSMGLDHAEPSVIVKVPDMPEVIYGKVTPEIAGRIVEEHILGKRLLNEYVYDKPAADIIDNKK